MEIREIAPPVPVSITWNNLHGNTDIYAMPTLIDLSRHLEEVSKILGLVVGREKDKMWKALGTGIIIEGSYNAVLTCEHLLYDFGVSAEYCFIIGEKVRNVKLNGLRNSLVDYAVLFFDENSNSNYSHSLNMEQLFNRVTTQQAYSNYMFVVYGYLINDECEFSEPNDFCKKYHIVPSIPIRKNIFSSTVIKENKLHILQYENYTKPGYSGGLIVRFDNGEFIGMHTNGPRGTTKGKRRGVMFFYVMKAIEDVGYCSSHLKSKATCCERHNYKKRGFPESVGFTEEEAKNEETKNEETKNEETNYLRGIPLSYFTFTVFIGIIFVSVLYIKKRYSL